MTKKFIMMLSLVTISIFFMGFLGFGGNRDVNDVIKLLKANVGEEIIKAHITEKDMKFDLSTKDILNLKKHGASDELLAFMMGIDGDGDFPFELEKDFMVNKPTTHEHLAIYPVFRKTSIDIEDYITLDEAQKANVIIITEMELGSVPVVIIRNAGKKPI